MALAETFEEVFGTTLTSSRVIPSEARDL